MEILPADIAPPVRRFAWPASVIPRRAAALMGLAVAASAIAGSAIMARSGLRLWAPDFAPLALIAAGLLALSRFCNWRYADKRLAHCAAIVGIAMCGLLMCAVLSNAGLRLRLPLADDSLAAFDAALGLDSSAVIRTVAASPVLVDGLSAFYNGSGLVVVGLITALAVAGRFGRAWELVTTTVLSMQVIALLSPLAPAWGAMRHFGLEGLQGNGLPVGAGVYQWPAFSRFYEGSDAVIRIADIGGIVAFPSFHTVLALVITQALAETRLRWMAMAATAMVILAAIPMGGHYVADLMAGWLVWLGCASAARRVNTPSN